MFPGTHVFLKEINCQECNRSFRVHWIEGQQEPYDEPATAICSDCMKGLPYETREIRSYLSEIKEMIEKPGGLGIDKTKFLLRNLAHIDDHLRKENV